MVQRTTNVNSGGSGSTPDVMEPKSFDATAKIRTARNKFTENLALCNTKAV